ncbi:14325_t:CDS:2 [Cetraspora pellucida]|uniref:14325_t:CDS:1 n=1 Tax=Cetraspora pellucida TaxID=1433469 RepID=A0A9N9GGP8_9GLOM|nr:14325_t:CDS:2 [Cetraspora pellucida]
MSSKFFSHDCPAENKNETDPTFFWDGGLHWDVKPSTIHHSHYFHVRDCYEAFVIAAFFTLLTQYVGDSPEEQKKKLRGRKKEKLPIPCCCITYSPTGHTFLSVTKWCILQYVVMKPIITFISLITEAFGVFCSESLSFAFARVYMKILTFVCVTVAMYALVVLYLTIKDDIASERPFLKFLCIKLVIFFAFWQSVVLSIVAELGYIKETEYWTSANVSRGLAAMLVCIEMAVFSFLHIFAFPYQPYKELGNHEKVSLIKGLKDAFNPIDILWEFKYVWKVLTRRKNGTDSKDFVSTVAGDKEEKNKNEHV